MSLVESGLACAYSRLSFSFATTCETCISYVVAGANERRLYSQAKSGPNSGFLF